MLTVGVRVLGLAAVCAVASVVTGCARTLPAKPTFSYHHQQALRLATEKALRQAEIDADHFAQTRVHLRFAHLVECDPGHAYTAGVVYDKFTAVSRGLSERAGEGVTSVVCRLRHAGVDLSPGSGLFSNWLDTKADVQLSFSIAGMPDRRGNGTARHRQKWVFGLGPETTLK